MKMEAWGVKWLAQGHVVALSPAVLRGWVSSYFSDFLGWKPQGSASSAGFRELDTERRPLGKELVLYQMFAAMKICRNYPVCKTVDGSRYRKCSPWSHL